MVPLSSGNCEPNAFESVPPLIRPVILSSFLMILVGALFSYREAELKGPGGLDHLGEVPPIVLV